MSDIYSYGWVGEEICSRILVANVCLIVVQFSVS